MPSKIDKLWPEDENSSATTKTFAGDIKALAAPKEMRRKQFSVGIAVARWTPDPFSCPSPGRCLSQIAEEEIPISFLREDKEGDPRGYKFIIPEKET